MPSKLYAGGQPLGKGLADATLAAAALQDLLANYKRRVAGNYRPLPPADIDKLPPGRMLIAQKIDGEMWFLVAQDKEIFLANPRGGVIAGALPFLPAAGKGLADGTIIAGELHARVAGRRCRVGDLAAAMAGGKQAKVGDIGFAAFDIVQEAGGLPPASYEERHARLGQLLEATANLSIVPVEVLGTAAQVRERFNAKVETGEWEGLILRLSTGLIHKLKPAISIDAVLLGYTVKADQPELARSVLLGLMQACGRMQIFGACGSLGSDASRRDLLACLSPLQAPAAVRYASDSGGLYTFVRPELVAEISVTDIQGEQASGGCPSSLQLSHGAAGWVGHGLKPSPRPIHPVLVRLRADKKVDATDVRFAQVESYLPAGATAAAASADLPPSTVVRREVWTKEAKGQTAVRKLLVWKTNKDGIVLGYPAYVVHWTDYSPARAAPLDRDVRLAPDEAEALRIAESLVEENIKKGWNKV